MRHIHRYHMISIRCRFIDIIWYHYEANIEKRNSKDKHFLKQQLAGGKLKTLKDQNGENLETGNKDILDTEFSLKSKSKKQCNFMSIAHCTFNILLVNSIRQGNQDRNSKKEDFEFSKTSRQEDKQRRYWNFFRKFVFEKGRKHQKTKRYVKSKFKPWYFC